MKKFILIAVVAVLSAINLAGALTSDVLANKGRLGCDDLVGCQSHATCPGRGTPSGCSITCEGGAMIMCYVE